MFTTICRPEVPLPKSLPNNILEHYLELAGLGPVDAVGGHHRGRQGGTGNDLPLRAPVRDLPGGHVVPGAHVRRRRQVQARGPVVPRQRRVPAERSDLGRVQTRRGGKAGRRSTRDVSEAPGRPSTRAEAPLRRLWAAPRRAPRHTWLIPHKPRRRPGRLGPRSTYSSAVPTFMPGDLA